MDGCIFCDIAGGKIGSDIVYQDEKVVAFNDVDPKAPVHVIVIPKAHFGKIEDVKDVSVIGDVFRAINEIVTAKGLQNNGYRIIANSGKEGGQAVGHVHFHVMAGRQMGWPPG